MHNASTVAGSYVCRHAGVPLNPLPPLLTCTRTAGVTGVVSAGFDVWLASLTVNAGITVARPSLTGYALWTSAMAAYARLVEPSCVSLTLSVHGLDIQISYTTSLRKWQQASASRTPWGLLVHVVHTVCARTILLVRACHHLTCSACCSGRGALWHAQAHNTSIPN